MKGSTFHPVYHLNDNSDVHVTERHLILKKKRANIYNFLKICSNLDLQNKNLCYNGCQAVSLGCPPHPVRCLLFLGASNNGKIFLWVNLPLISQPTADSFPLDQSGTPLATGGRYVGWRFCKMPVLFISCKCPTTPKHPVSISLQWKKRLPFVRDSLSNVNLVSFLINLIRE